MKAHRHAQRSPLALIGLQPGADEPAERCVFARQAAEVHEHGAAGVEQPRLTGHDVGAKPPASRERPDCVVARRLVKEAPPEVAEVALEAHTAPAGEVYGCIESGNGELGYYIVSAGHDTPWRARTRPPCFINYQTFPKMIEGHMISDVVAILGSINIIAAELDR